MVNYENSKIYKIVDNTNGNIYIGSTTESTLARRLQKHKANYNQYIKNENKTLTTSFNIIKNGDYDIILLEKCNNITSKYELHARERFYIENNNCVNKIIPGRTIQEYRQDNKEYFQNKWRKYKEQNKDKINEKANEYRQLNKDKINERRKELRKNKKLELEKNKNI